MNTTPATYKLFFALPSAPDAAARLAPVLRPPALHVIGTVNAAVGRMKETRRARARTPSPAARLANLSPRETMV
jgi:hypothetical protein